MEEAGKRTTKLTGVFTGTELALMVENPYFDERLPAREDKPELNFTQKRTLIRTDDEWQEVGTRAVGKEQDAMRMRSCGDVRLRKSGTQAPNHIASQTLNMPCSCLASPVTGRTCLTALYVGALAADLGAALERQ